MSAANSFGTETPASRAVLGKNVKVTGEIRSREPLTIEGEVEGTIDVTGHLLTPDSDSGLWLSVCRLDHHSRLTFFNEPHYIYRVRAGDSDGELCSTQQCFAHQLHAYAGDHIRRSRRH
jgi:hypothetical protein